MNKKILLIVAGVLAAALSQAQHSVNTAQARSIAQSRYGGRVIATKAQGAYIDVTLQNGNTIRDVFIDRHNGRIDHERHFQKAVTRKRVILNRKRTPIHVTNRDPFFKKPIKKVVRQAPKHRDNDGDDQRGRDKGKGKDKGKHLGQIKNGNNGKHLGQIKNDNKGKRKGDNDRDDKGKGKGKEHGRGL